jgi:hypothetical protein
MKRILFSVTLFVIANGCGDRPTAVGKPRDKETAMARVDAALAITSHIQKDEALAKACKDAAEMGAADAALKGLAAIVSHNLRDEVAESCALKLRDAGQPGPANIVAQTILSHIRRDAVLKKLATGS